MEMSEQPHESKFFGISVESGKPFHSPGAQDWATLDKRRLDIIRRLECYSCPKLVSFMYPTDDQGNILPKHCCQILDIDNANIEQENAKRHPTEQLLYGNCLFGEIPIPYVPRPSDYMGGQR